MLRRLLVSFLFVLFVSLSVKADPIIPSGTVVGGSVVASGFPRFSAASFTVLGPNGNLVQVSFFAEGVSVRFEGQPGTPVVFHTGLDGVPDRGNVRLSLIFEGTGPVIPDVNTPTLDLIGSGHVEFFGTVFADRDDLGHNVNPLFTISGSFSVPVNLHFTRESDGSYFLRTASVTLTPVPEPFSLLLFGSGLTAAIVTRRFFPNRRG